MPIPVITLLSVLLVVVTYLLAGRLLLAHTGRNHEATPLQAFLVGGGLWWLWSVVGHGFLGMALGSLWWLYLLCVVSLSAVLGKTHVNEGHSHTFWSRIFLVGLLAMPWLLALINHSPHHTAELTFDALWPSFVVSAQGLPAATQVLHFQLFSASVGSGFAWLAAPIALSQGQYSDALLPLLNVVLLGLLATEILRWRRITLNQDTVFAAVPAAFIVLAAAVGFVGWGWVWSSLPYVLLASLVVAVVRVLSEAHVPTGLASLGVGVVVMLLAQVTPYGLPLALLALVVYTVRALMLPPAWVTFLGIMQLWLLPLLGVCLWVGLMLKAQYPAPAGLLLGLVQPMALWQWPLPDAVMTLGGVGLVYALFHGAEKLIKGLGFHKLGLGASVVLLGIGVATAHATRPQFTPTLARAHVASVARALLQGYLRPDEVLAVLDHNPYYTGLMRMGLGIHNPVITVGLPDNLLALQNTLHQQKVQYLWVHAPDDTLRGVLDSHLQNTASYLYQQGQQGLILKAVFPHPGYTAGNLVE